MLTPEGYIIDRRAYDSWIVRTPTGDYIDQRGKVCKYAVDGYLGCFHPTEASVRKVIEEHQCQKKQTTPSPS